MNALVYVESPYQLLNSISYLEEKKCRQTDFFIRDNGSTLQKKQFETIVNRHSLVVEYFSVPSRGYFRYLTSVLFILRLICSIYKYNNLIVGDVRSVILKFTLPIIERMNINIILVDDGLYLLSHVKKILHKEYTIFSNLPLNLSMNKDSKLKYIYSEPKRYNNSEKYGVGFVGMKICEIGFMEFDEYIKVLKNILHKYKSSSYIYYAHRGENLNKLKSISDIGFEVIQPDLPLEEFLIKNPPPKGIYLTFYSTAIFNMYNMYENCDFIAIKRDLDSWPSQYREGISLCYKLFNDSGICVKHINQFD